VSKKVRIIGIIIMAVAVVFLVYRFLSFDVDFAELFTGRMIPSLAIVTVCVMAFFFISSLAWTIWLSFFSGQKVSVLPTYSVYARSNLAKYLPGNIGHYAMRQLYGTSLGIKQKQLLISTILEIFCTALTALILTLLLARDAFLVILADSVQGSWVLPVIIIVIVVIVLVAVLLLSKKKITISEIKTYIRQKAFRTSFLSVCGLFAGGLAIIGVTLLFLFWSVTGENANGFLIVSAGIASWFVGFITPGVPGGIGVREAVLLLMLSPVIPDDVVLFAAVAQRVSFILADIFTWVVGKALERPQAPEAG